MKFLASIGDIDQPLSSLLTDSLSERGHVARVVREAAVALDDRQRDLYTLSPHDLPPLVLLQVILLTEVLDHVLHPVLVEALAPLDQTDVETIVNFLELSPGHVTDEVPGLEVILLVSLQLHNTGVGSRFELLVRIKPEDSDRLTSI